MRIGSYWEPDEEKVDKKVHEFAVKRLDRVTRLLCALMLRIDEGKNCKLTDGRQRVLAELVQDAELQEWWKEHQRLDKMTKEFAEDMRIRKEHAELKKAADDLEDRVRQIMNLGGTPKPKLRLQHETALQALQAFEAKNKIPGKKPKTKK